MNEWLDNFFCACLHEALASRALNKADEEKWFWNTKIRLFSLF